MYKSKLDSLEDVVCKLIALENTDVLSTKISSEPVYAGVASGKWRAEAYEANGNIPRSSVIKIPR